MDLKNIKETEAEEVCDGTPSYKRYLVLIHPYTTDIMESHSLRHYQQLMSRDDKGSTNILRKVQVEEIYDNHYED